MSENAEAKRRRELFEEEIYTPVMEALRNKPHPTTPSHDHYTDPNQHVTHALKVVLEYLQDVERGLR